MSEYQITYWRDFPSMVVVRDGEETVKVSLASRFQEAIDEAAMRVGAEDADAYLDGWRKSDWVFEEGDATKVAERVSSEIENSLDDAGLQVMLDRLS
ncbi:MAG: virulence factor [Candidatus Nanopelagicales bacterium]|jgi:hypothetical protein|nr:virulence factor [Candidatus Nanopelagicales bacterium]MDP4666940.1 virulence factor [Candidatus Nanopelagicales bacterium]MDP4895914.1 virulence factor [Candidatus Nanopelagicales bacterium]MDP5050614.1 virulence factor [Candidatus Nanopelagicales bacterium]